MIRRPPRSTRTDTLFPYTTLFRSLATSPATRKVPYDPIKSFTPIGMIGGTPNVLVVNSKLPIHNFKEFVAYTKEHGGSVNYGSAGAGSLTHLLMELLKQDQIGKAHV